MMKMEAVVNSNKTAIEINSEKWEELRTCFSKDDIVQFISDTIDTFNIPLPYQEITKEDAYADFKRLQDLDTNTLITLGDFYSRYPYSVEPQGIYINQSNIGNKSSNFFHQKSRWMCDSINSPSPQRVWANDKGSRISMLNALFTLKFTQVTSTELRTALGLRKYIASQFRPSAAKAVFDVFKPRYILDPCAGWGDRLSGFMAADSPEVYVGVDPNSRLIEGYHGQFNMFCEVVPHKEASLIVACAEDHMFGRGEYDMVFTSPPYFIVERYTQENNQSWKKYGMEKGVPTDKKLSNWLNKFLFSVIQNSITALSIGGMLVINISDVYCLHRINNICDPLINFVKSTGKMSDVQYWGFRMSKRTQSKSDMVSSIDEVFCEPLWIWKKESN